MFHKSQSAVIQFLKKRNRPLSTAKNTPLPMQKTSYSLLFGFKKEPHTGRRRKAPEEHPSDNQPSHIHKRQENPKRSRVKVQDTRPPDLSRKTIRISGKPEHNQSISEKSRTMPETQKRFSRAFHNRQAIVPGLSHESKAEKGGREVSGRNRQFSPNSNLSASVSAIKKKPFYMFHCFFHWENKRSTSFLQFPPGSARTSGPLPDKEPRVSGPFRRQKMKIPFFFGVFGQSPSETPTQAFSPLVQSVTKEIISRSFSSLTLVRTVDRENGFGPRGRFFRISNTASSSNRIR